MLSGAKRDENGYYWVTGRTDDCMNVAGHLLSTAQIESALIEHESVTEAAVVSSCSFINTILHSFIIAALYLFPNAAFFLFSKPVLHLFPDTALHPLSEVTHHRFLTLHFNINSLILVSILSHNLCPVHFLTLPCIHSLMWSSINSLKLCSSLFLTLHSMYSPMLLCFVFIL